MFCIGCLKCLSPIICPGVPELIRQSIRELFEYPLCLLLGPHQWAAAPNPGPLRPRLLVRLGPAGSSLLRMLVVVATVAIVAMFVMLMVIVMPMMQKVYGDCGAHDAEGLGVMRLSPMDVRHGLAVRLGVAFVLPHQV